MLEIWQPRYFDNRVLIATYKVQDGENLITFTKDNKLKGVVFSVSSDIIKKCPVETNGKIDCYAVPMKELKRVEGETL